MDSQLAKVEKEPILATSQITSDLHRTIAITRSIVPTCLAVSSTILAVGCRDGRVHLFDLVGNSLERIIEFTGPTDEIRTVRFDQKGEYLGFCSAEGKVGVMNVFNDDKQGDEPIAHLSSLAQIMGNLCLPQFDLTETVYCMDISSDFNERPLLTVGGKDQVYIIEKQNLFGMKRIKSNCVYRLNPYNWPVFSVRINSTFVAFADSRSIGIVKIASTKIKCHLNHNVPSLDFPVLRCYLFWSDKNTVVFGADHVIKILRVFEKESLSLKILASFTTPTICLGLFPFDIGSMAMLTSNGAEKAVVLIQPIKNELKLLSSLNISNEKIIDFAPLASEKSYYVMYQDAIICVRSRDQCDHIIWLLERRNFEEAVRQIERGAMKPTNPEFENVINTIFVNLLSQSTADIAASEICRLFLTRVVISNCFYLLMVSKNAGINTNANSDTWMRFIDLFLEKCPGDIKHLISNLPSVPQICPRSYIRLIKELIANSEFELIHEKLKQVTFTHEQLTEIISMTESFMTKNDYNEIEVKSLLALCYEKQNHFSAAMNEYINIRNNRFFDLIEIYNDYEVVQNNILAIVEMNEEKSIDLFCRISNDCPDQVVSFIGALSQEQHEYFLHKYLSQMFKIRKDLTREYQPLQIRLYGKYERQSLFHFLTLSSNYSLQNALDYCLSENMHPEAIYLLTRVGRSEDALRLMVDKMESVAMAIDFCKQHDDDGNQRLWAKLVEFCSFNKNRSIDLLTRLSQSNEITVGKGIPSVDLSIILESLEGAVNAADVAALVSKYISNQTWKVKLLETCKSCVDTEAFGKLDQLVKKRQSGISLDNAKCPVCSKPIWPLTDQLTSISAFQCGHVFHRLCSLVQSSDDEKFCGICRRNE